MAYDLRAFKRPPSDSSLGLHYGPNLFPASEPWIGRMQAMHLKWTTGLNCETDQGLAPWAAAGIQPVVRPFIRAHEEWGDKGEVAERMLAVGLGPWVQAYNEPELAVEWDGGVPELEKWIWKWIDAANNIMSHGGYPGLQVLDPDLCRRVLRAIKDTGQTAILQKMWFCSHNYTSNHPPAYPYDTFNSGKTIENDWFCWLNPLKFEQIFFEETGHYVPCIAGEGGWCIGDKADARYPDLDVKYAEGTPEWPNARGFLLHRDYHKIAFQQFLTGHLPNGDVLPDWWFAVTSWLTASQLMTGDSAFEENAWYSENLSGTKQLTIDAIRAIPSFIRQFSWDAAPAPIPPPTPAPAPAPTPVPAPVTIRWRVYNAAGVQMGAYNEHANAVKQAHGLKGYALWVYPDDRNGIIDFRDIKPTGDTAELQRQLAAARAERDETEGELAKSEEELGQALATIAKVREAIG